MRACPLDLRERVLLDTGAGMAAPAVAAKYRVGASWVRRLKQPRRESGQTAPRVARRGRVPPWRTDGDRTRPAIREAPDATPAELRPRLGPAVHLATLGRAIAALGLTPKEKSSGRPRGTGRT